MYLFTDTGFSAFFILVLKLTGGGKDVVGTTSCRRPCAGHIAGFIHSGATTDDLCQTPTLLFDMDK